jgi:hypothetical protein
VSLSDTFASENIYSFTIKIIPKQVLVEQVIQNSENEEDSSFGIPKSEANNSSHSKYKKKDEVKGSLKLLKVYRNSRAELKIWPSS